MTGSRCPADDEKAVGHDAEARVAAHGARWKQSGPCLLDDVEAGWRRSVLLHVLSAK